MSTTNFVEVITSDMEFVLQEPYFLYKKKCGKQLLNCKFFLLFTDVFMYNQAHIIMKTSSVLFSQEKSLDLGFMKKKTSEESQIKYRGIK